MTSSVGDEETGAEMPRRKGGGSPVCGFIHGEQSSPALCDSPALCEQVRGSCLTCTLEGRDHDNPQSTGCLPPGTMSLTHRTDLIRICRMSE